MDLEHKNGQMGSFIRGNGRMVQLMEKEHSLIQMEIFMMGNGKIMKQVGMEFIQQMRLNMKDFGKKTAKMEKESKNGLMELPMKVLIFRGKSMAMGSIFGKTGPYI